ncbi:MAG: DNA polymerase III subunit gamma/tau [Bacilli bacterium]|nr:DNA polymerase III subunit gamma/tau [Bacilli bacterium]
MYQALYRKYRPIDFDSVVGQNAVVQTLRNSIISHNFSHAYLFFGPRGTGKTTVSKIFARNINCLDPQNGNACGKCEACLKSFSKSCMDILEIDAASNNGVDEIRDLKSKITLVPTDLKYKVYIIDEVHMLSIGAFNALLKTLEEPPEHAVFILATTDPQKVPETIVSRCQNFSFKRISSDVIFDRLSFVCNQEKIKVDEDVLKNIAYLSEGGMRDALGILDKLTSYTTKKITMADFEEVNGVVSNKVMHEFLEFVLSGDVQNVLLSIQNFENLGKNLIQIFNHLLIYSRNLLVDYYLNGSSIPFSIDLFQRFTNTINEKMFDIKRSDNTRIYIEMLLLKFIGDYVDNSKKIEKVDKVEEKLVVEKNIESKINLPKNQDEKVEEKVEEDEEYDFSKEYEEDQDESDELNHFDDVENYPKIQNLEEIMKIRVNNTLALADKNLLKEESQKFELLKDYTFDQKIGYLVCSLLDSKIRAVSPDNLIISYEYDSNVSQNLSVIEKLIEVYQSITKSNKQIAILSDSDWEKEKQDYISKKKQGVVYEVQEEPKVILEEKKKDDIISNSAIELFGDIVEIE